MGNSIQNKPVLSQQFAALKNDIKNESDATGTTDKTSSDMKAAVQTYNAANGSNKSLGDFSKAFGDYLGTQKDVSNPDQAKGQFQSDLHNTFSEAYGSTASEGGPEHGKGDSTKIAMDNLINVADNF